MGISPYWDDAHYCCHDCKKTITEKDLEVVKLKRIWRCPSCNGNLYVYASTGKWNYTLIRKYADEIEKGDSVLFLGTGKSHQVLNVEENNGVIKVALKGHGVVKTTKDDWVDVVWGSWHDKDAPWEEYPNI